MGSDYLATFPDSGLYVMQGRLSPPEGGRFQSFPRTRWEAEIELAAKVPLRGIEWIFDVYGQDANPLETPEQRNILRRKLDRFKVGLASICADYFMERPFAAASSSEME